MAAGRRVFDQLRRLAGRRQEDIAPPVAGEIGDDATGVAVRPQRAQQVSRIDFGGVHEPVLRPAVDQQRGSAAAVGSGGIGQHQIQVAVVVQVGELAARAAQGPASRGESLVFFEAQVPLVLQQPEAFARKDDQVPVAVLVRIARHGATRVGHLQAGGRGVQQSMLAQAVIDPRDGLALGRQDDQVQVIIIVKIVVHQRRDRQALEVQPVRAGQVGKGAVAIAAQPLADRGARLGRQGDIALGRPHRQVVQIAVAVQVDQAGDGRQVVRTSQRRVVRFGKAPLAIVQQEAILARAAEPQVHVAVVVDVAKARRDHLVG